MVNAFKVIQAMKLIILWREVHEFCITRTNGCKDCPYNVKGVCTRVSTEQVLNFAADTFDEFVETD